MTFPSILPESMRLIGIVFAVADRCLKVVS